MSDSDDIVDEALSGSRARHPLERPREPSTSPTFGMVVGVITIALGALVAGLGDGMFAVIGTIMTAIGLVFAGIGVVAAGVRLGMEWADYDRAMRDAELTSARASGGDPRQSTRPRGPWPARGSCRSGSRSSPGRRRTGRGRRRSRSCG